jgi:hypothetical protein
LRQSTWACAAAVSTTSPPIAEYDRVGEVAPMTGPPGCTRRWTGGNLINLAGGLAALGLPVVVMLIFFQHDLRGGTPADYRNLSSVVEPTRPNARSFTVGECLPGTITPWGSPRPDEYSGNATVTILSCRSQTRAVTLLLSYLAVAALALTVLYWWKRRS